MTVRLCKRIFFFLWPIFFAVSNVSYAISVKSYTFDFYGNLEKTTDPRGFSTQYHYDALNRLEQIDYPDGKTVRYSYDLSGNRTKMEDGHGATVFEPDEFNHITKVTFPNGQIVSYRYDFLGNLAKIIYPDATAVEYIYDLSNRLAEVKDSSGSTKFDYDEKSNALRKKTLPNGFTTEYLYYKTRKISNVIHRRPDGTLIEEFHYEYDENGNRTKIEKITPIDNKSTIYTYDKLDRIKKAEYSDGFFESYTYDEAGNRRTKTTPTETIIYQYDEENRLRKAGETSFDYDPAGNLIKKSSPAKTTIYIYDFDNRLVSYKDESTHVTFEYDGDGNRISKTVNGVRTEYINDLVAPITQVLLKRVQGNWWKGEKFIRYVYGGSRISQWSEGNTQFYLQDSMGRNVSAIIDSSGKVLNQYEYDSFGNILSESTSIRNVYQFCGEQLDEETGLIYLRNRYYDPEIGRFISKDFYSGRLDRPSTLNPYCYVENNPVNFVDPLGFEAIAPERWERVILHTNDLPKWFGGQGAGGHACLEFPDRDMFFGNYPQLHVYDESANINSNTTSFEFNIKSQNVTSGISVMEKIKWTLCKNCVYTVVEGLKTMGVPEAEKIKLSIIPLPSELRAQMLELHGRDSRIITYPRERTIIKNQQPISSSFVGPKLFENLDYGGVSLSKTAELQLSLADIAGVAFDSVTGQLVLFGPENRYFPPVDLDDLAVAVRSVYGIGASRPEDPGVSIDPSPIPGQMQVRYDGATANTSFGQVMFEADRLLKCLELGKDNITGQPVSANVFGYSSLISRLIAHQVLDQANNRMWFVPEQITLVETEDHKGIVFSDVRMKVLTESQFNGSSLDRPACREFAQHFSEHFDDFAKEFPIFEKLKTLGKITAIVKWIRENNVPFDISFFVNYRPKSVETTKYTPSFESRGTWNLVQVERRHVQGHRHKKEVSVPYPKIITLTGGIEYKLNNRNFATYVHPAANEFANTALKSRPSEKDFTWSFRSPTNQEMLMAVAQSIYRTKRPGNVKKNFVDMSFPVPGSHKLAFQRVYSSFSERESAFGYGWRIVPYELELPLEKVAVTNPIDNKTCTTYRTILVRTPEGEHLYRPFAFSQNGCPLFKGSKQSDFLQDNLNGTFTLEISQDGFFDFDQQGRLCKLMDKNGFTIEYIYNGSQLSGIRHQNGSAIILEYKGDRISKVSGPGNSTVRYDFHDDGQLQTVWDIAGVPLHFSYDKDKRLKEIIDHQKNELFKAIYDDYNRAITVTEGGITYQSDFSLEKKTMTITDSNGGETVLKFDNQDRLIQKKEPFGLTWKFGYEVEDAHLPNKITDPRGHVTECRYDALGNLAYFKNAVGAEWFFFYLPSGNLLAQKAPNGKANINHFIDKNLIKRYFNASFDELKNGAFYGLKLDDRYSAIDTIDPSTGLLLSRENSQGAVTTFKYDKNGQLALITFPLGYAIERKMDEKGRIYELSDSFGIQKGYVYDDFTERLKEIKTASGTVFLDYHGSGDLKRVLDNRGHATCYNYDNSHNLKEVIDGEGGVTIYDYNASNQLEHFSLPNRTYKTIEYDLPNRTIREIWGK